MQAVLQSGYGSADVLRLGTTQRPSPSQGEVIVRVHSAAIDRGTWHLMTGRPYLMRMMGFGFSAPKNPIPGLDLSGTVVEVGAGVTRFKKGDQVFGIGAGSFAEFAKAREDKLAHAPKAVPLNTAAALGVSALTAIQALRDHAKVEQGDHVLIIGASGGVGTFAVQIAKALGAEVTAVCSSSKVEMVRSLGAARVFDYTREKFYESGEKYDAILDIAGNTPIAQLRRVMTPEGRLVFIGNEHGGDYTAGFGRQIWAMMLSPFTKQRFAMMMAREHFEDLEAIAQMVEKGQIRPAVDRVCSLGEVPAALTDMEAGHIRGKVIVRVEDNLPSERG
ncbi:MAG: NAD(P)-dependent alcohol dehydrogenase [Polyangiaceae bacterium]|nr:NAD(P)-dependent alcohol dehydrogenase [Polyangiaceae bacterium]